MKKRIGLGIEIRRIDLAIIAVDNICMDHLKVKYD
jgi:hypothetical protein